MHGYAIRVLSGDTGPRFLGLTVEERNARVVRRTSAGAAGSTVNGAVKPEALLRIPPGVVITPALVAALPPPAGTCHLVWSPERPPIVWSANDPASSTGQPRVCAVPEGAVLDVSDPVARRASAWRLLRASGKATDGWLARHVHRKISRLFSYVLLNLGLTPNTATFLVFLVGAASGWFLAQESHATMVLATALFWFASIADGIDGEMARLTLRESVWGHKLDTAVDRASYVAAYAGLMIGCWRQGLGPAGWAVLVGSAAGVPVVLWWVDALAKEARGPHTHAFMYKPIEVGIIAAATSTGAPALTLAALIFRLFRRESFSAAFFLASLFTGRRIVVPMLLAGGMVFVVATLTVYRELVVGAMRERYAAGGVAV